MLGIRILLLSKSSHPVLTLYNGYFRQLSRDLDRCESDVLPTRFTSCPLTT